MRIASLDHLVLTVRDLDATLAFYCDVLGMAHVTFAEDRHAVAFGTQRLNLHIAGRELTPNARAAAPGTADLCFLAETPLDQVRDDLRAAGVAVELGPVEQEGAAGPIRSLYVRDPDGNLVEIANAR